MDSMNNEEQDISPVGATGSAGDPEEEFVRELTLHQNAVLAYIRSMAPGYDGARDLLQEVNITLWQKRANFTLGTNFKAWAFQIARYHMLNQRRRLARHGWLIFDDDLMAEMAVDFGRAPDELDERQEALRVCLNALRPQDRELIRHRYQTPSPLQEFAERTNRRVGTLKAMLFKIRAVLRRCIEQKLATRSHFPA